MSIGETMSAFCACGVMFVSILMCLPNYKYGWNKRRILLRIPLFCINFGLLILCLLGHNDSVALLFYGTFVVSVIVIVAHEMYCRKRIWDQQSCGGAPVLYEDAKLQGLPPECGLAPSGGVFCMAERRSSGEREQAGGCCAVFPKPEAAVNGISGPRKVSISNNMAENTVRPFVVGRKSWQFCNSVKGVQSGAIVYSLVETVKVNGLGTFVKGRQTIVYDFGQQGSRLRHHPLS